MTLALGDFEGVWRIDRQIDDRLLGRVGHFAGTATFTPDGDGLDYRETGTLTFPGLAPLSAEQRYLWRQDEQGVAVCFSDGRSFHRIPLNNRTHRAGHDCAPDRYRVRYDFAHWPDWTATWQVSG
ncbi:MAG: DUF6314 family protein, partial [Paracoccaceae bacterium]|nr:DUF6314 family protein [Paracoccaceae bacterium]